MIIRNMATTWRHNQLVFDLRFSFVQAMQKLYTSNHTKMARFATEEIALVYEGDLGEQCSRLINISLIEDKEYFSSSIIDVLRFIQPDLFMFAYDNMYLTNKKETRVAGRPNLIVEVWSESNFEYERTYKRELYSTSPITEHWYIEQDNNTVTCYKGTERLPDQDLRYDLKTHEGIIVNIAHLAL